MYRCSIDIQESLPEQQVVDEHFFEQFVATFSEKCPLLKNVVETLLVSNVRPKNMHKNVDYKVLCGAHALSLLLNVRSAKGNNDLKSFLKDVIGTHQNYD